MEGIHGTITRQVLPRVTTLIWLKSPRRSVSPNMLERGTTGGVTVEQFNELLEYTALRHTTPLAALDAARDHVDGCLLLTASAGGGAFDEHAFERLSCRPKGLYTVVDGKSNQITLSIWKN